jgi:TPR repeat protein
VSPEMSTSYRVIFFISILMAIFIFLAGIESGTKTSSFGVLVWSYIAWLMYKRDNTGLISLLKKLLWLDGAITAIGALWVVYSDGRIEELVGYSAVGLLISGVTSMAIFYALLVYFQKQLNIQPVPIKSQIIESDNISDEHWVQAAEELTSQVRNEAIWAKVFSEADGDESKAKARYIKIRVEQLHRSGISSTNSYIKKDFDISESHQSLQNNSGNSPIESAKEDASVVEQSQKPDHVDEIVHHQELRSGFNANLAIIFGVIGLLVLGAFLIGLIGEEKKTIPYASPDQVDPPAQQSATYESQPLNNSGLITHEKDASFTEARAAYRRGDYAQSLKIYRSLADQGNALAQYSIGVMYDIGGGVKKDYQEALKWYRLAAAQGHASAQYSIGVMYTHGLGVTKNYQEALKWHRLAADQGNADAQYNIGYMYTHGIGVTKNYQEALKWYRLSAAQGDAAAQSYIGGMYAEGLGVTQDYQEALKWHRLAADQGNVLAQNSIGYMYSHGQGVQQNYQEALKWHRLAANQGDSAAQIYIGNMYRKGYGVTQSYQEALKWYRLAADQGNADAQNNVGIMYDIGQGVTKDYQEALKWFRLAAAQGNASATESLKSPEMVAAARNSNPDR